MNSKTYSRSYLQGIQEKTKQDYIDNIIHQNVHLIHRAAVQGDTSYMYDINIFPAKPTNIPVLTNKDYISGFQRMFPDCDITYKESWIDSTLDSRIQRNYTLSYMKEPGEIITNQEIKILKKGFLVVWS